MDAYVRNSLNAVAQLARAPRHRLGAALGRIGTHLMLAMIYTALYFKHPAYASEREYRYLVATRPNAPTPGLLKRARRNVLIDYLGLDWKTSFANALQSIKIGPAGKLAVAQKFIADTTNLHFPGPLVVEKSIIPFQG
jgi:hypothetical protein